MSKTIFGEVTDISTQYVTVKGSDGQSFFLSGICRPKNVKVGDRGTLKYRSGPNYGLWFFTPDNELNHE